MRRTSESKEMRVSSVEQRSAGREELLHEAEQREVLQISQKTHSEPEVAWGTYIALAPPPNLFWV